MSQLKSIAGKQLNSTSEALRAAAADVNKYFKNKSLMGLADEMGLLGRPAGFISTGCYQLDLLMRGGMPLGKIVELFGRPGSGKSTLAATIAANCQRMGGVVVLIDSESSWEEDRMKVIGVDLGSLLTLRAVTLEDGFDAIEETSKALRTKSALEDAPVLIVWDTIRATRTRSMVDAKKMEDRFGGGMMERPILIGVGVQRIEDLIREKKVGVLIVNQISSGQKGEDSSGGFSFKHSCAQRLKTTMIETLKDSKGPIGIMTQVRMVKNKVSGPLPLDDKCAFPIYFDRGIDGDSADLQLLKDSKIDQVWQAGAWMKVNWKGNEITFRFAEWGNLLNAPQTDGMRDWVREMVRDQFLRAPREDQETKTEDDSEVEETAEEAALEA